MQFIRYQHIDTLGRATNRNINEGWCHIFPKLDGTNGSVWRDSKGNVCAGSRNRKLSDTKDNAGFYHYVQSHKGIREFLNEYPSYILYGEFLVPHTFKKYHDSSWRKFYVFDVVVMGDNGEIQYVEYDDYIDTLKKYGINYIPRIDKVYNLPLQDFKQYLDKATFLVSDNTIGEGIVIKNYDYVNYSNQIIWGKIISDEFTQPKPKLHSNTRNIEETIVNQYLTVGFIEKECAKVMCAIGGQECWEDKLIPRLLGIVYHEFLVEELPTAIHKLRNPTINFHMLRKMIISKIKEVKPELF